MIRKEDVRPGVRVRIDKVECRNLLPGFDERRTISLNAYAEHVARSSVTLLLLGETLEILSAPRKLDGINLVQVRNMTGEVGEVYYMDIHDCCTLLDSPVPQPRRRNQRTSSEAKPAVTVWDRLTGDDE